MRSLQTLGIRLEMRRIICHRFLCIVEALPQTTWEEYSMTVPDRPAHLRCWHGLLDTVFPQLPAIGRGGRAAVCLNVTSSILSFFFFSFFLYSFFHFFSSFLLLLLLLLLLIHKSNSFPERRGWLGRASAECAAWLASGTSSTNRTSPSRSPSRTTRTSPSMRCGPSPNRSLRRSARPGTTTPSRSSAPPPAPLMRPRMARRPAEGPSGRGRSPVTSPGRTTTRPGCLSPASPSTSRISNPGPFPGRRTSLGLVTGAAGRTVCRTARWTVTTPGRERSGAGGRGGGSSRGWRRGKPAPTGTCRSLWLVFSRPQRAGADAEAWSHLITRFLFIVHWLPDTESLHGDGFHQSVCESVLGLCVCVCVCVCV